MADRGIASVLGSLEAVPDANKRSLRRPDSDWRLRRGYTERPDDGGTQVIYREARSFNLNTSYDFVDMPVTLEFDAILFDMDGTLVDSTDGVVGAWELFAEKYPSLDVTVVLSSSHGVRTVENLRKHCGVIDPEELERESRRFEDAIVAESGKNGRKGIVPLPGVREIMAEIGPYHKLPKPKWAICTSATVVYATSALKAVSVPIPDAFVVSEDVEKGKPEPDPYLLGAKRAGVDASRCLVVEDAPAGIRSGRAAGCKTLGLITSHSREQMEEVKPDWLVPNLASVTMKPTETGVQVTLNTD